jgi:hypothetical protein
MISEIIQNNRGWPIWINGIRLNRKQGLSLGLFLVNQALSKQTARETRAHNAALAEAFLRTIGKWEDGK